MSHTLSAAQLTRLPTHNLMVGRLVGQILDNGEQWDKPCDVMVDGEFEGMGMVVRFARQEDGSVSADGYVGGTEIHEHYEGSAYKPFGVYDDSHVFGVAGSDRQGLAGTITGSVGEHQVEARLGARRDAQNTRLTDEMRERAGDWRQVGVKVGSKRILKPDFGGPEIRVNVSPTPYPAETRAIRTTDELSLSGDLGPASFGSFMEWNTTTWAVVYDQADGFHWEEYRLISDGGAYDGWAQEGTQVGTPDRLDFQVDRRLGAELSGTMVSKTEDGSSAELEFEQSYRYVREKSGYYHVEERLGEQQMTFDVYAIDKSGARAAMPEPGVPLRLRSPVAVKHVFEPQPAPEGVLPRA